MIDPRERIEEYLDDLLEPRERAAMERALAESAELRAELERVRRFATMMEGLGEPERAAARARRRTGSVIPWALAAVSAAALLLWLRAPGPDPVLQDMSRDWDEFGERLATIALERRDGRVPRTGLSDLEVPPSKAFGRVYGAGLRVLGVELDPATRATAQGLVREHFASLRALPEGIEGEWRRSESALGLYRELRRVAGREAADAYYDMFRPGLTDANTARRVSGNMQVALAERAAYWRAYDETCRSLRRRYGRSTLTAVMDRLAPDDARFYLRDASQDGAAPDAVLSIRAALYRAAAESGSDRLYLNVG